MARSPNTEIVETEILVIGSGAGGAVTAATLARAGRTVTIVEEGPWVDPDATEPFSLEEMVAKYRHGGTCAALGRPAIAYAEGRCVGGSTEINSGLYHRLPGELAEEWQRVYRIDEFGTDALDHYSQRIEDELGGVAPSGRAAGVVGDVGTGCGQARLAGSRVLPGVPLRVERARGQADDGPHAAPQRDRSRRARRSRTAGCPSCCAVTTASSGARCERTRDDGTIEQLTIRADHVFVCAGATQTPALLQRSGIRRNIGNGLKMHPTVKIAARFEHPIDHGDVPMHRVTEFAPGFTIGGSASRRGHVALALADSGADYADALADWERVAVYYAAIRSEGHGRVFALPGFAAPLVTYNLSEGDMSRLARALLHLGEVLLAAGATEMYPSVTGGVIARGPEDLVQWLDATTRNRANLMSVHLTSTVRIGENRDRTGADSFGRVWGFTTCA